MGEESTTLPSIYPSTHSPPPGEALLDSPLDMGAEALGVTTQRVPMSSMTDDRGSGRMRRARGESGKGGGG
eukprot:2646400-Pyramimonas_sp.AAC.1